MLVNNNAMIDWLIVLNATFNYILVTTEDLLRSFDNKIQQDMAILDFSKAFDTVPHKELLNKLHSYGIEGNIHQWLSSFLQNRKMRVVVEGEHSDNAHVDSGVPQGTVLEPLLFFYAT